MWSDPLHIYHVMEYNQVTIFKVLNLHTLPFVRCMHFVVFHFSAISNAFQSVILHFLLRIGSVLTKFNAKILLI